MDSRLTDVECNICADVKECFPMPCCLGKNICSTCLPKLTDKICPYCRKEVNIITHVTRVSNIPKINYIQCAKVFSIILYAITSGICIFLMGYGLETGMNETSMFVTDMIVFILLNILHVAMWNVTITTQNGNTMIMADQFGYKYYLGGVLQNSIYIFFFFYFKNHFFLNSMIFIMVCYNCLLFPIYNMFICMWDQCGKTMSYQEQIIVDNVTYESDATIDPPESEYQSIQININDDTEY